MNLRNMLSRLTWNYRKDEDSNIYKLFATLAPEIEHLKEAFEKIESWGGIENAEGTTLDLIGEDVRQERLSMSDEQYRQRLRFRAAVNRSDADINSVNTAMRAIAGANYVRLYEAEKKEPYLEPAAVIAQIQKLYPDMPFREMEHILAAGVRLLWEIQREERMPLHLGIATRKTKEFTIYPSVAEDMQNEKSLYIGIAMSKRKEDTIYPSAVEDLEVSMALKFCSHQVVAKEFSILPKTFSMVSEMGLSNALLLIDGGGAVRMERKSLIKEAKVLE